MSALVRLVTRVREWLSSRRVDRDLADEVQAHVDHLIEDYQRRGLSAAEARRAAMRDFGGVEAAKESVRDARGFRGIEVFQQDVRYAIRGLWKTPAFSLVAITTLALGIGANTAIFSLVDAVMLKPLPYHQPDRLVALWESAVAGTSDRGAARPAIDRMSVSVANYIDYTRLGSYTSLAGYSTESLNLTNSGAPERLSGEVATASYFDVLGARAALGRTLLVTDEPSTAPRVVVLSDALWRRRFGANPRLVGTTITLDAQPWEVVGVMPPDFRGVTAFQAANNSTEFWVAPRFPAELLTDAGRGDHEISVVGRLRDGVAVEAANRELRDLSERLATAYPDTNGRTRATVGPLSRDLVRDARTSLLAVFAMVALILLIACVNVANLLLVRGVSRKREMAIRLALGAERARVIRGLLTESLVLALAGGSVGLALGYWTQKALVSLAPANTPRLDQVALDGRVLAAGILIALVTGVVFGIFPAWQASRERPAEALRSTERVVAGTSVMRWRNMLMAVEVALSAVLLVGAGLTLRSLINMNSVPLGFRTDRVLVLNTTLPETRYATADQRFAFFDTLTQRLEALPGVDAVGFANRLPLRGGWSSGFQIAGATPPTGDMFECDFQAVSSGYFAVLGMTLRRGRPFDERDTKSGEPVAIVSEAFGRKLLNGGNPIGRTIRRGPNAPLITIVGVVDDVRRDGQLEPLEAQVYLPAAQTGSYPVRLGDVAIRASGDPRSLLTSIQEQIWAIDPNQPITQVRLLDDVLFQRGAGQRFRALLFGICAGLALLLSLIGVYGVVSYSVSQRTPEIGVRLALGADRGSILRWLVGRTAGLVTVATLVGLVVARLLSQTLDALLFDVATTDWRTYAVAAASLCGVAIGAATLAARKATRIDPVQALRGE